MNKPLEHSTSADPASADNPTIPPGFRAVTVGGPHLALNGPLYMLRDGADTRFGLRVEERHTNPMGNLHGGMMGTFCDMLLSMSAFRQRPEIRGRFLPTISLQIDYLAPAPLGCWLEGRAEMLRVTRSLVFAQGLVTADGTPCARTSGVFKIGPAMPENGEL